MDLKPHTTGFKHLSHPILTKRKMKALMAKSKGFGEKIKHSPLKFLSGCPFCEWHTLGNTRRPVEVGVSAIAKKASCKSGHIWSVIGGSS